jgi:hypothetical protein
MMANIPKLEITIATGDDDLRGDSSVRGSRISQVIIVKSDL